MLIPGSFLGTFQTWKRGAPCAASADISRERLSSCTLGPSTVMASKSRAGFVRKPALGGVRTRVCFTVLIRVGDLSGLKSLSLILFDEFIMLICPCVLSDSLFPVYLVSNKGNHLFSIPHVFIFMRANDLLRLWGRREKYLLILELGRGWAGSHILYSCIFNKDCGGTQGSTSIHTGLCAGPVLLLRRLALLYY